MADGKVSELIELGDARHRLKIVPSFGGGIADAVAIHDGRNLPLLRPWAGPAAGVLGLGCNVLVPFSNRISGGGFFFEGQFHDVKPNLAGEPYPIHGDGFQAVWHIKDQNRSTLELTYEGGIGPYHYAAVLRYALAGGGISIQLQVTNLGLRLPFGGGFHPWFPRFVDTHLTFSAYGVWTEKTDYLPDSHLMISDCPDWDFRKPRMLPHNWINAAFTGWNQIARINQPSLGIAIEVSASRNLDCAIVYSPGSAADFFCFEPVCHTVDAHNQPGQPGLQVLDKGETFTMSMNISWVPLEMQR